MTASKRATARSLGSDLKRADRHVIQPAEYEELPELTDEMFARGTVIVAADPGRQTRMADKLSRLSPK